MKTEAALIKCDSYDRNKVFSAVKKAVDSLGGVQKIIRPQSRVLVKPNLLMAVDPASGVVTHPEVVRSVIRLLKEQGCQVFVGDGPSVWGGHIENVQDVYKQTGILAVAEEEGAELVDFDKRRWRENYPLTRWLDHCEHLVNVPKFKTHGLTLLTGAVKNLFGLVSGTYKTEIHKKFDKTDDFAKVLVDIYQDARPGLTIIDGILSMEGEGPGTSGKTRRTNFIMAGSDCVALDSLLAVLMGIGPMDVPTNRIARDRGLGVTDIAEIKILGEELKDVFSGDFLLPQTSIRKRIPQPIINLLKRFIKYYPSVDRIRCIKCSACIKACPSKVISMQKKGIVFDYSGCIACFCCQEVCPAAAITLKKSIFAKIVGL